MSRKICENCGENLEDYVKFCPECGSSKFRQVNDTAVSKRSSSVPAKKASQNSSLIHKLFYWSHDGYYMFSKTKLIVVSTVIVFLLSIFNGAPVAVVLFGFLVAAFFYVIGFGIHRIIGNANPSRNVLENNDQGLIRDLWNALLCWQNKNTGEFVFSKTKILTLLILLFFSVFCYAISPTTLLVCVAFGSIFAAPACLVGYAIHKLTNNNPTPKKVTQKPKPQITPKSEEKKPEVQVKPEIVEEEHKFSKYQSQLDDLRKDYDVKEKHLRDLIAKRFEPPQLTYSKFMSSVDNCTNIFNSQADSIQSMIEWASEDSKKIDDEINSKLGTLNSLIGKIEDLSNELVLNMDKSEDTKNLLEDMDDLIESVDDYD